jgi:5'-methylthioadenosine phosphorylase
MIAIIAGTGIEKMGSWVNGNQRVVLTKHGHATLYETKINGTPVCFLPRHSGDHSIAPHLINHKANIAALKKLGVNHIIATCSVGSLRVDLPPGSIVLISDFISATGGHIDSFFSEPGSPVVHTDLSTPYCPNMRLIIESNCRKLGVELVNSGTYVGVLGPRYETPAEVRAFRIWGGDIVGMTCVPECILAREAGICYAALAIVTNLGTGLDDRGLEHGDVTRAAQDVLPTIEQIIQAVIPDMSNTSSCSCHTSVQDIL